MPLVGSAEVLEDPTRSYTAEQVASLPSSSGFQHLEEPLVLRRTRPAYWLRMTVVNDTPRPAEWFVVLPGRTEWATLYERTRDGRLEAKAGGRRVAFQHRDVLTSDIAFRLALQPGEAQAVLLRLDSERRVAVAPTLWTAEAFAGSVARERLFQGGYYGLLLALLAYNLFVFFAVRDRAYLHYVVAQLAIGLVQASIDSLTFQFLWPQAPDWTGRSEPFFTAIAVWAAGNFARSFLGLRTSHRRLHRTLLGLQAAAIGLGAAAIAIDGPWIQDVGSSLVMMTSVFLLYTGVRAWASGNLNAPIFVLGWSLMLTATLLTAASTFLSPADSHASWKALKVGSSIESLVFAVGLAYRMKRLRQEREAAQAKLLETQTSYAQSLESRVEERTRELASAVQQLQSTQAQLVKQGRLALLGHLAAGVAHEVGNPLSFSIGGARIVSDRLKILEEELAVGRASESRSAGATGASKASEALAQAREAVGVVEAGNARIERIVNNLRSHVASRELAPVPTDLAANLESTLALMDSRIEKQAVRVHRRIEPVPPILARPGELNQVLMNLILNSLQAMPSGGDLHVTCAPSDGGVELTVADTGAGVSAEHRDAIFDPFFTTRPDGTGLGLSISHEIVARHGGELFLAESPLGAKFVVRLPLALERPSPTHSPES